LSGVRDEAFDEWMFRGGGRRSAIWDQPGWDCEHPSGEAGALEMWCYADRFSYLPGDSVQVHSYCTTPSYSLEVVRDGAHPQAVLTLDEVPGGTPDTREEPYANGCGWPVSTSFEVGANWRPGLYLLVCTARADSGEWIRSEGFIVVRAPPEKRARLGLVLTTSTLLAYNDWGGANHYRGVRAPDGSDRPSPRSSARRPIARGFLKLPPNAPRATNPVDPPPLSPPRYPSLEWSRLHGYSRCYANAFWATYERPFVVWAEQAGYDFDYLTQHDLHFDESALDEYNGIIVVGHDEYWSWEMRDRVDAFLDRGGFVARFGGNFLWQVRIVDEGDAQLCWKRAEQDPLWHDPQQRHLVTSAWDRTGRSGALTMGLRGEAGVYSRYGSAASRAAGGLTVYRPDHWIFAGTGLEYGDQLGGPPSRIASYEMDGLDYMFRHGLPYPTGSDGATEEHHVVLAMAPATAGEVDRWAGDFPIMANERDLPTIFHPSDEAVAADDAGQPLSPGMRYGSGMLAEYSRGPGTVVNTGTSEWVNGLIHRDPFVERVTNTILDRALTAAPQREPDRGSESDIDD
jgi:N,N-dimethylformamidase beta subunit-like protein